MGREKERERAASLVISRLSTTRVTSSRVVAEARANPKPPSCHPAASSTSANRSSCRPRPRIHTLPLFRRFQARAPPTHLEGVRRALRRALHGQLAQRAEHQERVAPQHGALRGGVALAAAVAWLSSSCPHGGGGGAAGTARARLAGRGRRTATAVRSEIWPVLHSKGNLV
jgi:hypothetical protein